jgi:hypothetical protein
MRALRKSVVVLTCFQLLRGSVISQQDEAFDSWFWHVTAGLPALHLNDEGSPFRLSLGGGRPLLFDRTSLMADLVFAYYEVNDVADKNPRPGTTGGGSASLGFDLLLRIECLKSVKAEWYLEGGVGFQSMLSDPPFPADGSENNFTLFFGPGVLFPTGQRSRLSVSLQWFHISNAWLFNYNSGYDGVQLVLGSEWSL